MDDVFDTSGTDKEVEIKVANQEWLKQMRNVVISGEREAISDGFDSRSSAIFDRGLDVGFEAVKDLALLKGRLLYHKSLRNTEEPSVDRLLSDLESLIGEVFRAFASSKERPTASEVVLPTDLSSKIASTKEEVNKLLIVHKDMLDLYRLHFASPPSDGYVGPPDKIVYLDGRHDGKAMAILSQPFYRATDVEELRVADYPFRRISVHCIALLLWTSFPRFPWSKDRFDWDKSSCKLKQLRSGTYSESLYKVD
uniref:Uncharacterized protein n=1 Tax=Echinococcus canadensis TaxID=519352 RepID=A0A915EXE6_9CEST